MLNILNYQWQHHVLIVTWFFKYGKPEHSFIQGNDIKIFTRLWCKYLCKCVCFKYKFDDVLTIPNYQCTPDWSNIMDMWWRHW